MKDRSLNMDDKHEGKCGEDKWKTSMKGIVSFRSMDDVRGPELLLTVEALTEPMTWLECFKSVWVVEFYLQ
ncbi:hypothetical protein P5673_009532 [Acropora cervicornis]|uniref:Uncharacterized protein n=1 Tax=Acropora cervicornis TaxID=6130 RepID=A0AAD9QT11_ACRCE|nr:hypothetical protein P5673_009532 [Acropora cervicornis]